MLNILVIASFIGHGGSIKLPPVLLDRDGAFGCHQFCRTWWVLLATARFNVPVGRLITAIFIGHGVSFYLLPVLLDMMGPFGYLLANPYFSLSPKHVL